MFSRSTSLSVEVLHAGRGLTKALVKVLVLTYRTDRGAGGA